MKVVCVKEVGEWRKNRPKCRSPSRTKTKKLSWRYPIIKPSDSNLKSLSQRKKYRIHSILTSVSLFWGVTDTPMSRLTHIINCKTEYGEVGDISRNYCYEGFGPTYSLSRPLSFISLKPQQEPFRLSHSGSVQDISIKPYVEHRPRVNL